MEIKCIRGTMTFSAPGWPDRTWLIPDGMVIRVTEGPPEPLPTPEATKVAAAPGVCAPRPSPCQGGAIALGGLPGPTQIKVLRVLAEAYPDGRNGKQIAEAAGIPEGSVYGCTSGMVRQNGRWWVAYNEDGENESYNPRKRYWFITERGQRALELAEARETVRSAMENKDG